VAGYFGLSLPESRRSLHHVVATALIWHHLVKLLGDKHDIHTFHDLQEWLRQPATLLSDHKRAREYPMDEGYRKDLPNLPGIYRMYRSGGDLLYIGKAKSLKQRISSYFHKGSRHPEHILEMLSQAKSLETTVTNTSIEASLVESDEIKRLSPPYNRALRTNERGVLFFSRDLKSSNPQPDSCHSVGPLPSFYYLNSLVMLGDVLNGSVKKVSLKVIKEILDIPSEYLPDRDCFVSGLKTFRQEFQKFLQPAFNLATLMAMGTHFWKEKLEEQAAEEDITGDSEAEEILELKMQEFEEKEIVDTWTPERIVKVLKSIIRLGAFQIRRSRWFCRLSESSLGWTTLVGDAEDRNLIVFKGGISHFNDPLSPSETIPVPPAHTKSLFERQKNFDLFAYDRMRITTTEIRRLIQEDRTVELCLHADVYLRNEQLKKILQWV
jgi:DNA polymerase-3 subunit epsilon